MQEQLVGFVYEKSHLFDIPVFICEKERKTQMLKIQNWRFRSY